MRSTQNLVAKGARRSWSPPYLTSKRDTDRGSEDSGSLISAFAPSPRVHTTVTDASPRAHTDASPRAHPSRFSPEPSKVQSRLQRARSARVVRQAQAAEKAKKEGAAREKEAAEKAKREEEAKAKRALEVQVRELHEKLIDREQWELQLLGHRWTPSRLRRRRPAVRR
eukprot:3586793-Prymnesium_polylepis.2